MLPDGLYRLVRSRGAAHGPEQTMYCSAYNDVEEKAFRDVYRTTSISTNLSEFQRSPERGFGRMEPFGVDICRGVPIPPVHAYDALHNYLGRGHGIGAWSTYIGRSGTSAWGNYSAGYGSLGPKDAWLRGGTYYTPLVFANDGYALFGFTNPGSLGTITKISIYTCIKGEGKTQFRNLAGAILSGTTEKIIDIYKWIYTDYADSWNWPDISNIKAGVWLKCDSGMCRDIFLRITYITGGTETYIDLRPTSTYSSSFIYRMLGCPTYECYENGVTSLFLDGGFQKNTTGLEKYYSSNFSHFPPSFSKINKISIFYSYSGCDGQCEAIDYYYTLYRNYGNTGVIIKPFIYINGSYYFGTAYSVGSNESTPISHSLEWATNPATGQAWTYHEAQGARFGLVTIRPSTSAYSILRVYSLYAAIHYQERETEAVAYKRINIHEDSTILTQYTQQPIQADMLTFSMDSMMPERTEIALVRDGQIRWKGIVWVSEENKNKSEIQVIGKSQQIFLDYRVFPGIYYFPRNKTFMDVIRISDLLSDDTPTYPNHCYLGAKEDAQSNKQGYWQWANYFGGNYFSNYLQNEHPNMGLFYILNSHLAKLDILASHILDREMFSYDSIPKNLWDDFYDISGCAYNSQYLHWEPPPPHIVTLASLRGGLFRLDWRSLAADVGRGQYHIAGDVLTTQTPEGSTMILADHAMDMHIRPGTNDMGDMMLNCCLDIRGIASTWFSDFYKKMGQEVRFRYDWNGETYIDASIEIASGSIDAPLRTFRYGHDNCKIITRVPQDPSAEAVVGLGNNPKVNSAWTPKRRPLLHKIYEPSRTGEDLQEYIDSRADLDDTIYQITVLEEIWHMRPGDYIAVQPENDAVRVARIRQITTRKGMTVIQAGQRLLNINDQFGIWRDAKSSTREFNTIRSLAIPKSTGFIQSQEFTILAEDIARGDWSCRVKVGWDTEFYEALWNANNGQLWPCFFPTRTSGGIIEIVQLGDFGVPVNAFFVSGIYSGAGTALFEFIRWDDNTWSWRKDGETWSGPLSQADWHSLSDGLSARSGINYYVNWADVDTPLQLYICSTFDVSSYNKFLKIILNGKVIPPGRYIALNNSGSLEVDITEFCNTSPTTDVTNTLVVELFGGYYEKIGNYYLDGFKNCRHILAAGSIDQYKRFVPLEVVS